MVPPQSDEKTRRTQHLYLPPPKPKIILPASAERQREREMREGFRAMFSVYARRTTERYNDGGFTYSTSWPQRRPLRFYL